MAKPTVASLASEMQGFKSEVSEALTTIASSVAALQGGEVAQASEPQAPKTKAEIALGGVAFAKATHGSKNAFVSVSNGVADDGRPEPSKQPSSLSGWKGSHNLQPEVVIAMLDNGKALRALAESLLD